MKNKFLLIMLIILCAFNFTVSDVGHVEFRIRGSLNQFDHIFSNPDYDESTADENSFWERVIFDIGKTNIYINDWIQVLDTLCWVQISSNEISQDINLQLYGPEMELDYQPDCRDYPGVFLYANYNNDTPSWADISWNGSLITNGFALTSTRYAQQRLGEDFWYTNFNGVVHMWTNQIAYLRINFENITEREEDLWRESAVGIVCTNCWECNEEL
jgi:hypothetical protein